MARGFRGAILDDVGGVPVGSPHEMAFCWQREGLRQPVEDDGRSGTRERVSCSPEKLTSSPDDVVSPGGVSPDALREGRLEEGVNAR